MCDGEVNRGVSCNTKAANTSPPPITLVENLPIIPLSQLTEAVRTSFLESAQRTIESGTLINEDPKFRSNGWFLTINNPTELNEELLKTDDARYVVYQIERGLNGTEHIQGLVYYKNPRVWPKRRYPTAHIERVKNLQAAIKYCMKEDTRVRGPYEIGVKPEQGRRTDLEELAIKVKAGVPMKTIADEHPTEYGRYARGLKDLKSAIMKPRSRKNDQAVIWLWGEAGAGKTSYVLDMHGEENVYVKNGKNKWWDGYEQQRVILLDDFDGSKWDYRDLLCLLDTTPYQGEVKGGTVQINSPYIYITCEHHPKYWYGPVDKTDKGELNHWQQINRRIDEIIEVKPKSGRTRHEARERVIEV